MPNGILTSIAYIQKHILAIYRTTLQFVTLLSVQRLGIYNVEVKEGFYVS